MAVQRRQDRLRGGTNEARPPRREGRARRRSGVKKTGFALLRCVAAKAEEEGEGDRRREGFKRKIQKKRIEPSSGKIQKKNDRAIKWADPWADQALTQFNP